MYILAAVSAEDARERGELQRAYYSLLHATTHNELTGVHITLGQAYQGCTGSRDKPSAACRSRPYIAARLLIIPQTCLYCVRRRVRGNCDCKTCRRAAGGASYNARCCVGGACSRRCQPR